MGVASKTSSVRDRVLYDLFISNQRRWHGDAFAPEEVDPMPEQYTNDPKAYELTVTLHEDDDLAYEAEYGLPDGFQLPASEPATSFSAVALVPKKVNSTFKGIPKTLTGSADTAMGAIRLAWDFIETGRPKSTSHGASTAVLATADMAWDHYAAAKKFSS
jgi:hypothetical protein